MSPAERISLIGDEWAQVRASKEPVGNYLDLLSAVKADSSAEVLRSALKADPHASRVVRTVENFQAIDSQIAATADEKAALAEWIRKNFAPILEQLGPPSASDSDNTRELRAKLFSLLGLYGKDPAVIAQARELTAQYLADSSLGRSHAGLRAARTLPPAMATPNSSTACSRSMKARPTPSSRMARCICSRSLKIPHWSERALEYAASSKVRSQDDAHAIFHRLADRRPFATWPGSSYRINWERNPARQLTPEMGSRLVNATGNFCSAKDRDSVEKFFAVHKVASTAQRSQARR